MPAKILLADKSITIQKVVEMLFSGRDYTVVAVSDGETALNEASRIGPDVVLADVDLPRLDGYSLSERLKQDPQFAGIPVILMLSRDDVFDDARGQRVGIVDRIAKPFESQDLIGKVKKALGAAVAHPKEAAPPAAAPPPRAAAPARPAPPPPPQQPKAAVPADIFDIIQEAPTGSDLQQAAAGEPASEQMYEVEPEIEMGEPFPAEDEGALPTGERAHAEMRTNLGLGGRGATPESASFPGFAETPPAREYVPPSPSATVSEEMVRRIVRETMQHMAGDLMRQMPSVSVPEEAVQRALEETVTRVVREMARDMLEKIAWEVFPDMAEMLIRQEIEKLKAETRF